MINHTKYDKEAQSPFSWEEKKDEKFWVSFYQLIGCGLFLAALIGFNL